MTLLRYKYNKNYQLLFIVLLSVFVLSGCSTTSDKQPAVENDPYSIDTGEVNPDVLHETKKLTFLDSESLDIDISESMEKTYQQIELAVPSKFPLHEIPERIEHWIAYIKKHGGEVQTVAMLDEGAAKRGVLLTAFEFAISYMITNQDDEMYNPAEFYHARLYYAEGTGEVERIVFYLRN